MNSYVIIPGCDDGNRGDQALVWETKRLAEDAGFRGQYSMLCSEKNTEQSVNEGILIISPILGHPGRKFKINNLLYSPMLLLKWGSVAAGDYLLSRMIFHSVTRALVWPFLPDRLQQSIRQMEECDACFVKGGGFFHSYGKITDIYLIYYYLYHIRLAEHFGKKVYVMPNSFGPFMTKGIKHQIRKALSRCEVVTARETISHDMLKDIGVESMVFPDLAFKLAKSENAVPELHVIREKASGRELVAITARPYRFPNCADAAGKYKEYINALTEFAKWVYCKDFFPVLVEHVISSSSNESDIISLNEIASSLDESNYYLFSNPSYSSRQLKELYSNMDVVIGTRFHSVIFALASGIPAVAIAYGGNKGRGIMKDIGLCEYTIDMDKVTLPELIDKFNLVLENKDEIKEILDKYRNDCEMKRKELAGKSRDDSIHA